MRVLLRLPRERAGAPAARPARSSSAPTIRRTSTASFVAAALPFRALRRRVLRRRRGVLRDAVHARGSRALVNIVPVDPDANLVTRDAGRRGGPAAEEGAGALSRGRAIDRRRAQDVPQGRARSSPRTSTRRSCRSRSTACTISGRAGGRSTGAGCSPGASRPVRVQFGAPIPVARGDYAGGTQALRDAVEKMLRSMRSKT